MVVVAWPGATPLRATCLAADHLARHRGALGSWGASWRSCGVWRGVAWRGVQRTTAAIHRNGTRFPRVGCLSRNSRRRAQHTTRRRGYQTPATTPHRAPPRPAGPPG
jgi:hypothetical protein